MATPKTGYTFVNWTENDVLVSESPSISFPATRDRTLTANFEIETAKKFGTVNLGQSLSKTITISNGIQPVIYLGQAQLTGANTADFSIPPDYDTCSGHMVNRYDSCTMQVVFTPQAAGLRQAVLNVLTTNGDTVFSYPLVGDGFAANLTLTSSSTTGGAVSLSGSQLWGGTATATATPNTGYAFTGWLEDGVTVSSAPSYSFTVTASRDLLAMFSSTPAAISATPSSGYFGATNTGTASPEHAFTITNSGLQSLSISAISLSGINRAEFGVTYNDCVQDLSPGASCSIRANFTPASPGTKAARLNIASSAPATLSYVIDLSGYGGTPVMRYTGGFSSEYYPAVQSAYNEASDGNEIRLWATDFNESLNCNRPLIAVIRGGYNGNFADRIGKSALQGTLTISSGTVVIDKLQIGGTSYQSTLTVDINSPGAGGVTSSPAAIDCPGNCTATFVNSDQVTLTASPVGDSTFTGWSGGSCSGTGSCTFTITDDTTVTASFSAAKISVAPSSESLGSAFVATTSPQQTITVTSSGTQDLIIGTLSFSGSNPTEFTIAEDFCSGHTLAPSTTCTVQVSFIPASSGAKTANLTIPSNDPANSVVTVSLNGIGTEPTISVFKAGNGLGTVTSSPAGISCGSSCTTAYPTTTTITLTTTPDIGYTFSGWSGACSGIADCTLDINADITVTATFDKIPVASCSANPAKVDDTYYPSIQTAYNAAPDGGTIKLLALDFTEDLSAGQDKYVTLDGGYLCGFATNPDTTVLHGDPHISAGTVKLKNMRIAQ